MEPTIDHTFEQSIERLARRFEYPLTPDMTAAIRPQTADHRPRLSDNGARSNRRRSPVVRRLAWMFVTLVLLAATALAVPQSRAAVLSLFARIGAIDIFMDETAPTSTPAATAGVAPATSGSAPHSLALFDLGEPVALDEARRLVDFDLVLPAALGEPDEVYIHRGDVPPAVTLVWRDKDGTPLSLTEIGAEAFAMKMVAEEDVRWIKVSGQDAVWLEGPHQLQLLGYLDRGGLLIESNVLIWAAGGVTYRLEGGLDEAGMVAIAESVGK